MPTHHTRRSFLLSSAGLLAGSSLAVLITPTLLAQATPGTTSKPAPPPRPPALPLDKVQTTVGVAHRNLEKVRELVEETPLLANASWDWGGGDFETPLQAAAHTGGREIAEYLLSKNARIDIYAAAMLGRLEFIKAAFTLDPNVHLIPGPHGFTLLHCAKQGGERAKPVMDWMLAQGVPEVFHRPLPFVWPPGTAPTT
jgi:hypothetical protein